jgi:hypothetical protein
MEAYLQKSVLARSCTCITRRPRNPAGNCSYSDVQLQVKASNVQAACRLLILTGQSCLSKKLVCILRIPKRVCHVGTKLLVEHFIMLYNLILHLELFELQVNCTYDCG